MRSLTLLIALFLFLTPAFPQSPKSRTTTAKPSSTPTKKVDEKSEFEAAVKVADPAERIAALDKFTENFPKSKRADDIATAKSSAYAELAAAKLKAGDGPGAAAAFKEAALAAPKPIPEKLWSETLSKLPLTMYFAGARGESYDAAETLEEKTAGNAAQTIELASFYLTVEDGTPAMRLAESVLATDANSSPAYQTIGFAHRVELRLEDSLAAFVKAVELDPASLTAKRGLAEAKRSLGKPEEAISLYHEILEKEPDNLPAQTGLVLSLFDSGKREAAEAEMAKLLAANDGNVILLAGAAYWYAAHNEGARAVEYAQKAIAADPRYIWSHIALSRGSLLLGRSAEAEKALFAAQRYGNFPALQYEIATARFAGGYYQGAADALAESFVVKDGVVSLRPGAGTARDGKNISELVGYERRASIFEPAAADDAKDAARLVALLELKQQLEVSETDAAALSATVDRFTAGDDRMRVFRLLYAARTLLDKRVALSKVMELTTAATSALDAGLDAPSASTAVMAGEIYDIRMAAERRGEYVEVPAVPRNTVSSLLRGEIESTAGWVKFLQEEPADAVVRLKRAVSVLPTDSSWWRTATWRLGSALAAAGKDTEALDAYLSSYISAGIVDPLRYTIIEGVYRRVKGNLDGLAAKIGPNPLTPRPAPEPSPEAKTEESKAETPKEPAAQTSETTTERPCVLTVSQESPVIAADGGSLSVIVSAGADLSVEDVTATASDAEGLSVKRDTGGIRTRAIFSITSAGKPGVYSVTFESASCGKKEISVTVK